MSAWPDELWQWLDWHTPLSVLLVLGTGILAASIVMSLTGFGSAIAHLCVWSIAKAAGIEAGTMQQAIVTEVVFRSALAIPYMRMTNAQQTAKLKLVVVVTAFSTAGTFVGAWLLGILDERTLELILAGTLTALQLLQFLAWFISHARKQSAPARPALVPAAAPPDGSLTTPLLGGTQGAEGAHQQQQQASGAALGDTASAEDLKIVVGAAGTSSAMHAEQGSGRAPGPADEAPLASPTKPTTVELIDWWPAVLAAGFVAGTLAGVAGSLTGVGGPPLILMFVWLKAGKDVVRGTGAVMSFLGLIVRIWSYVVNRIFVWDDVPLYLVAASVGWVGTMIGQRFSGLVSEVAFSRILNAMIWLCVAAMLASALGRGGQ